MWRWCSVMCRLYECGFEVMREWLWQTGLSRAPRLGFTFGTRIRREPLSLALRGRKAIYFEKIYSPLSLTPPHHCLCTNPILFNRVNVICPQCLQIIRLTASHLLSRRCGYRTILEKNLFNGVHLVSCAHLTCNGLERPAPCVPYSAWKVYVARLLRSRVIHYGCRVGQPPAQDGGWRKCRWGEGGGKMNFLRK